MTLTWYCARTKPRREERACEALTALGVAAYLPRERVQVERGHGKRRALVVESRPLIPRHLFVGIRLSNGLGGPWRAIAGADGVDRLLSLDGRPGASEVPWRAIAIVQTVEAELDEDFQRRIERAHRHRRRGKPDTLIAALKAAPPDARAEVILSYLERREGSVTLKLAEMQAA